MPSLTRPTPLIAQRLFNLFVNRTDTYAEMVAPKPGEERARYTRVEDALTVEVVDRHLRGEVTVGPYQLDRESRTKTLIFDIDPEHVEDPGAVAKAIYQEACKRLHPDGVILEASRWPDPSYHVWVCFAPTIPASVTRWMGRKILEAAGNPKGVEVFPKQDRIDPYGFGNFVKLPLGLHRAAGKWSRLLDPATMQPLPNEAILEVRPLTIPEGEVKRVLAELERGASGISGPRASKMVGGGGLTFRPCFTRLMERAELSHDERVALVNELEHQGYSLDEVKSIFHGHRAWTEKYDPAESDKQVESVYGHYGHFTRGELEERRICFEECPRRGWVDCRAVPLSHINLIEDPILAGRGVVVEAVVASTSLAFLAPSKVEAEYEGEDGLPDKMERNIAIDDPLNLQLIGINEAAKYKRLKRYLGLKHEVNIRERLYRTIYRIRVRPPVFTLEKRGDKILDERGFEYKAYDVYIVTDRPIVFQPSSLIQLEGTPIPNPKSQQTTLLAYRVEFPEEAQQFDAAKLNILREKFKDLDPRQRLDWILSNFEKRSRIVGRRNLAEAELLTYFTPIWLRFDGSLQRGWGNTLICGDTTTAKTETCRQLIALLKAGTLITGETASTVGLTGTTAQVEREGWFIDWGFLVLLDRKLLAVDGAHKLSQSNWASLAEAERSGVVSITKAAKNTAYARTRQIKIANPVDREADKYTTKSLGGFLYACQALTTVLDKTSIARLDLAVFSNQWDVPPDKVNTEWKEEAEPELDYLAEAVKWCWSGQAEVEFTPEAVKKIHEEATSLYHTFFCEEVPLVSIDMKYKLARLSAAMAYLTLSTEDLATVKVTSKHVELVTEFIREEYTRAGLNTLAQATRYEVLDTEDVKDLLLSIQAKMAKDGSLYPREKVEQILTFIILQGRVTREQLKTQFSLSEHDELRPLLSTLQNLGLVKSGRGFYPEPKLIQAYKVTGGFKLW